MVMEKFWDCEAPALSITLSVNPYVPRAVGVPEIKPCDPLSVSPGGRDPASDQLYGGLPPVAESVIE